MSDAAVKNSKLSPEQKSSVFWMVWAGTAAFGCYFCMYGLRKPFTSGSYTDSELWGIGFKTILVTTQVAGYMISKFIGIKIIAEMPPHRRALTILYLVLFAEAALIMFGVIPRPWNAFCLFLNGLPLGMIFGLVLGFLEGRKLTELLAAGLCLSFILADGVTKSVGTSLLKWGVAEDWMPSYAGAIFLLPLGISVLMLAQIPPPTTHDISARSARSTMDHQSRSGFVRKYAWGLIPIVLMYLAVTIVRSIRSDFGPEILSALGMDPKSTTFATSEMLVGIGVMAVNGGAVLIFDNRRAFFISLATCGAGFVLLSLTLIGRNAALIDAFYFYVLIGLGMYLPYVAIHTTVFERMLGMTREPGTTGFLMYVADSFGYLGYVAVMLTSNYLKTRKDLQLESGAMLNLLTAACWATIGLSTLCLLISWRYFRSVVPAESKVETLVTPAEASA
jgi:Family of unknown function (DUF5690)